MSSSTPKKRKAQELGIISNANRKGPVTATHAIASPFDNISPYHAFSKSPPVTFTGQNLTTCRLLWNEQSLFVCWELEGVSPMTAEDEQRACVACFLWQPSQKGKHEVYTTVEIDQRGNALCAQLAFNGSETDVFTPEVRCQQECLAVGHGASSSPVPSAIGVDSGLKQVMVLELRWASARLDAKQPLHINLGRASEGAQPSEGSVLWESWTHPVLPHLLEAHHFAVLRLAAPDATIDCSCCAARLLRPKLLRIVQSPRPSLEECPPGSLLVRAKFASVCGSDMPYFTSNTTKAASSYWDRDGFCGHEVVGVVIESKSTLFAEGDAVMSLPSSYFKAHTGSKQEWYREHVHGVLLEPFPVRGGFSQVYTSHELYTYKVKECVPRMLAAQGLGTVLRMARRIGSVLGKSVVVVGQGQNGLLATRLLSQMCCKTLIAVEPLAYRREAGLKMGAHQAVSPEDAVATIMAATAQRGADVVCEMVGHNQGTINACLDYVACAGTVAAFGVPDDSEYNFQYSKFFRKNVNLIASVIPDPGLPNNDPDPDPDPNRNEFCSHHVNLPNPNLQPELQASP